MDRLKFGKLDMPKGKIDNMPQSKVMSDSLDLRSLPTDVIVRHLEGNLKIRDMHLTERLKKGMLR